MTTWVLDTNVLIYVDHAQANAAVAQAILTSCAATGDTVCTVDEVIRELKRDSARWPTWRASPMCEALPVESVMVGSPEDEHLQAMRAVQATRTRDQGERACIAWSTTVQGAVFVTNDAGSMRLAITEFARVRPVRARVATVHEWLAALKEHGGLPMTSAEAVLNARGRSASLPTPTWWR